jgi:hypothetical protein
VVLGAGGGAWCVVVLATALACVDTTVGTARDDVGDVAADGDVAVIGVVAAVSAATIGTVAALDDDCSSAAFECGLEL